MKQSPLFLKSFETLLWLLEHTRRFPKHQRFVMAKRMEEEALSFHDSIVYATRTPAPSSSTWSASCSGCSGGFWTGAIARAATAASGSAIPSPA